MEESAHHLCARDILLGVQEVVVQRGLSPLNGLLLVSLAVGEALCDSRLPSEQTTQIWALQQLQVLSTIMFAL